MLKPQNLLYKSDVISLINHKKLHDFVYAMFPILVNWESMPVYDIWKDYASIMEDSHS